jgi:biopolymer transport protein ExbB/TolQ
MIPAKLAAWVLRHLPGLALVAVLGGAVWFIRDAFQDRSRLRAELATLRADLAAAHGALEQAAETARVHRAHLEHAAEKERAWVTLSNDLQDMEGRDAPLSPLLSATADRLFGTR